ncbi:MAG: nucleotidyltransferase family protein [Planctomycetota bacterium]|nr:nucleotidyltransferase family protein [Planctomycetota bacterium]
MNAEQLDALIREQGPYVFDRMFGAMEKVRERLEHACGALAAAGVPYAVIGGNAVAAWVATRDEGAMRNTQDVDILLHPEDADRASEALAAAGFQREKVMNVTLFLDGPDGKPSQGVHVIWAGQKVKEQYFNSAPNPEQSRDILGRQIIDLVDLVRMTLSSHQLKDRVHVRDLIGVGLIDASWPSKFEPPLNERLQALLDDPDG